MNIYIIKEYLFDIQTNEYIVLPEYSDIIFDKLYQNKMGYRIYMYSTKCNDGLFNIDKVIRFKKYED